MKNKIALITGGTSGIGESIAIELSKNGYDVILNYSNSDENADNTVNKIVSIGNVAHTLKADLNDQKQIKLMFSNVKKQFGKLDLLVNNAGVYSPDYIESENIEIWDTVINLNLRAKFLCTKYAIELLKESELPKIINISSRASKKPMEESVAYCCAASGIEMLTKVSAKELSKYKIKVNSISPGLTRTPMTEKYDTEEDFKKYAENNPLRRVGQPEDIANVVLFLVSENSTYVNGENIDVSGGDMLI